MSLPISELSGFGLLIEKTIFIELQCSQISIEGMRH